MSDLCAADVGGRFATIQTALHGGIRVHLALQHATPIQLEEAIDEHLTRRIKSLLEPADSTNAPDHLAELVQNAGIGEDATIGLVILVPQLQRVRDGIAKRPDSQLQRPTVADERADVQRDQVVGRTDGRIRGAEESKVVPRVLDNRIYQQIAGALTGSLEYAAMAKVESLARSGQWDLVVLDTPPTANALDFLDAPGKLTEAIDSPAIEWLTRPSRAAGRDPSSGASHPRRSDRRAWRPS